MADIIAPESIVGSGKLTVSLAVTKVNSKSMDKRLVLEIMGVELSVPLGEVDQLLASIIEERNKGLRL